ncbi:oxysterol binding protein [Coprinopsis cinerea okayama7|uniref:Oxysterol binding protein n=1 Tax=Coprinopsis cinerea (strain Okayama-7 / 130 / ATCC MYA-4618 / FGSC 9003) TaxID=240176 RepID=A8N211_COPC7|nr:oxysterol binding protein [Coprinopsis cinerea okayama7\|eukprot:XP_001828910.2 oxysterol binding protein [Coprinopsis cinerea okayama7\
MASTVCEGWLLKKRRKKMQGFARRFFTLHTSGVLSYSFGPGQPVRDQLWVQTAAISTAVGRKDIHIDSSNATFHIKCLSTHDFDMWMAAFRKFINSGAEAKRSASIRMASRQGSAHLNRTGNIVEEMAATIQGLDQACTALFDHVESAAMSRDSSTSSSRRSEKERYKEKFALFKKPSHSDSLNVSADSLHTGTAVLHERIRTALEQLKAQHAALSKMHQPPLSPAPARMPPVLDVEEGAPPPPVPSPLSPRAPSRHAHRMSRISVAASSRSDSIHEWYDALDDGPEEFVMDESTMPEQQPSQITADFHSISGDQDGSSVDTDIEEPPQSAGVGNTQIAYRTQLPVPAPADEGSLFAILKKNVGKDLSTITFPVTFNEPLTLLQRSAEELEYWDLLNQAVKTDDPVARISYVAAFAVSGYAHTRHRSGRKGFNPMLGETFEDVRMKFIAEKVRHNPVEIAYHAEGKDWDLTGLSAGRTKFWGKSLEIIPSGSTRVRVGSDYYVWRKPSTFIRNLMVGTKYFEHTGQMTIENVTTGMRCVLDFKQNGYWGPTNVVSGTVNSSSGEVLSKLEGKWDDQMAQTLDGDRFQVLWRCSAFPKNSPDYYGFTAFGITLNEVTKDIAGKLPPTDSRLRPDVRALENGDLDVAEEEKLRVEELQRERRKRGEDVQPRWFKQAGEEWEYLGGYWEARGRGWKSESLPHLW